MDLAGVRILIVDDEPPLLKVMERFLSRLGYRVETNISTDAAWSIFEADPTAYSLVMLDMTIPGMTAEEFANKAQQLNPDVRLILTSGYPVEVSQFRISNMNRAVFLHKPFTPDMLAETVGRLLASRKNTA